MSVVPLKRFLVELTGFETEAEVARPSSAAQSAESAHYATDREAELEAAVARGREEAEAEASSAIEQLEREHETRLAATLAGERARWVMTEVQPRWLGFSRRNWMSCVGSSAIW